MADEQLIPDLKQAILVWTVCIRELKEKGFLITEHDESYSAVAEKGVQARFINIVPAREGGYYVRAAVMVCNLQMMNIVEDTDAKEKPEDGS